jgi:cobalt-zinc-cadmium efflux system outer membrane protein
MRQLMLVLLYILSYASFADADDSTRSYNSTNTYNSDVTTKADNRLTMKHAITNVLEHSPAIKAADYELKAAAARIRTAKLSPAYRGSIELENFAGSGLHSGSDALETTLSLSKVLELGDKAKMRGDVSHNKAMLLRNEQDSRRLDLLAETAKRFIEVITDQHRLVNAYDSIDIVKRTKQIVEKRVKAGKSPTAELRRTKIKLSRSELKLKHARHKLEATRLKLAILWGEMPPAQSQLSFTTADAELFKLEQLAPFESLITLLERNPDLVRFATEERLSQSRTLLARSTAQSDIEISGGMRHFNATDDTALVLSLNVPFGSSSRATSNIKEAEMVALQGPHIYQQQRLKLYSTLFELHHESKHAFDAVTALRETIIPQAELALQDYEKGYAAGRYSFLELTEAQQLLVDLKLEKVVAASDYHRYRIEIDRLTGAGLSTDMSTRLPTGVAQ